MSEHVVVDFSRVHDALSDLARARRLAVDREGAAVAKERAQAAVKIITYSAAACALIIVSIGVAIWLARYHHATTIVHHPIPEPARLPLLPTTATDIEPANKVVTKITLFNTRQRGSLPFANPHFRNLSAGHQYKDSNSESWEHAWCYADFEKDGLTYEVRLATRIGSASTPRAVTQNERQLLGLSEVDVSFLRTNCPWRD